MPEVTDPAILAEFNTAPTGAPAPGQQLPTVPSMRQIVPRRQRLPSPPPQQTPAQAESDTLSNILLREKVDEAERERVEAEQKKAKIAAGVQDTVAQMGGVINAAKKAKKLSNNWFATGFGAEAAKNIGGSSAADVAALLNTIGSNTAFDRLQKMREESPTGGALGAVSEIELQLLRDSIAAIGQSQSDEQFQENMDTIIGSYQRVIDRLEGKAAGAAPAPSGAADDQEMPAAADAGAQPAPIAPPAGGDGGALPGPPEIPPADVERNTSGVRWEDNPELAGLPAKYAELLAQSRPASEVVDFLRKSGVTDPEVLRTSAEQATFRRNNPDVPLDQYDYSKIDDMPVDMSMFERAVNSDLGQYAVAPLVGAADTLSMGGLDELAAAMGNDDFAAKQQALAAENPGLTAAGQVAGGFVLPISRGASLGRLAAESGGYGAAYGFGSGEGGVTDRLDDAAVGGALGVGIPLGLGKAMKTIASRRGRVPGGDEAVELARAAEAEGVPISRPIVDPGSRARMARVEAQPGGHAPVRESLDKTREGLTSRVEGLRGRGAAQEPGVMGQRIQEATRRDMDAQRSRASDLYTRASEAAGDAIIVGREAVAELDDQIAKLGRNPNTNRALMNYLRSVRSDFVDKSGELTPKTVDEIRQLRTSLSGEINRRNLTMTPAERIVSRALDKAKRDIDRDLYDAGPKGAQARSLYREADILWRLAKRDEKQVARRLLGPADAPSRGDQAMNAALAWVREGAEGRTLARRFWEKLNKDEQEDFAATLAEKFGRRASDEDFSPAYFLQQTRNIPESSRKLVFGPEGAQSISNLRNLSRAYQQAEKSLNNSRSGMVANWSRFLAGLSTGGTTGAALGFLAGGVPGGVAGGVALSGTEALVRRVGARMLMSPDMTRWLATAPKARNPEGVLQHVERLSRVAARNPAIAQDVLGLRSALLQALPARVPAGVAGSDDAEEPGRD